jgi:hypothetical protein
MYEVVSADEATGLRRPHKGIGAVTVDLPRPTKSRSSNG